MSKPEMDPAREEAWRFWHGKALMRGYGHLLPLLEEFLRMTPQQRKKISNPIDAADRGYTPRISSVSSMRASVKRGFGRPPDIGLSRAGLARTYSRSNIPEIAFTRGQPAEKISPVDPIVDLFEGLKTEDGRRVPFSAIVDFAKTQLNPRTLGAEIFTESDVSCLKLTASGEIFGRGKWEEVKPVPDNLQGSITPDTPQEIAHRNFIAIVHFLA